MDATQPSLLTVNSENSLKEPLVDSAPKKSRGLFSGLTRFFSCFSSHSEHAEQQASKAEAKSWISWFFSFFDNSQSDVTTTEKNPENLNQSGVIDNSSELIESDSKPSDTANAGQSNEDKKDLNQILQHNNNKVDSTSQSTTETPIIQREEVLSPAKIKDKKDIEDSFFDNSQSNVTTKEKNPENLNESVSINNSSELIESDSKPSNTTNAGKSNKDKNLNQSLKDNKKVGSTSQRIKATSISQNEEMLSPVKITEKKDLEDSFFDNSQSNVTTTKNNPENLNQSGVIDNLSELTKSDSKPSNTTNTDELNEDKKDLNQILQHNNNKVDSTSQSTTETPIIQREEVLSPAKITEKKVTFSEKFKYREFAVSKKEGEREKLPEEKEGELGKRLRNPTQKHTRGKMRSNKKLQAARTGKLIS